MARIRSIHPGLFTDEAFMSLSPLARVFLMGIWVEADDHGAFEWKPVTLKARILPADNADVLDLLGELVNHRLVNSVTIDGTAYGLVRNFCKYQRPKKPTYKVEIPEEWRTYIGLKADGSPPTHHHITGIPPRVPNPSPTPPGKRSLKKEEGGRRKEEESSTTESNNKQGGDSCENTPPKASKSVQDLGEPLNETFATEAWPVPKAIALAKEYGLTDDDIAKERRKFMAKYAGDHSADWEAAFVRWIEREIAWRDKTPVQPKAPPRIELSVAKVSRDYQPTEAEYDRQAALFAKSSRWSHQLGPEPGQLGCRCPPAILRRHGINPETGLKLEQAS